MKVFSIIISVVFFTTFSIAQELGDGNAGSGSNNTSLVINSKPSDYGKCTAKDKKTRIQLHDTCLNDFKKMGLGKMPDVNELVPKFSCSKIESTTEYSKGLAVGCLKYAVSLPVDIFNGLKAVLGVGKYDSLIAKKCGEGPQVPQEAASLSPYKVEDQKKLGEIGAAYRSKKQAHDKCANKVIKSYKDTKKAENAKQGKASMETYQYCIKTRPELFRISSPASNGVPAFARPKRGKIPLVRQCQLDALTELSINCSRCVEEFTDNINEFNGVGDPSESSVFQSVLNSLKEYRGFQCFNAKAQGELVCAAISNAAGVGALAVTGAKVAKALGKSAAQKVTEKTKRIIALKSKTPASLSGKKVIADDINLNTRKNKNNSIDVAKVAAEGAGDSLESRKALGELVLKKDGLLGEAESLTEAQATALWKAHKLPDSQVPQKALILRQAGFSKNQIAALVRGREDLGGKGVAGGYSGSSNTDNYVAFQQAYTTNNFKGDAQFVSGLFNISGESKRLPMKVIGRNADGSIQAIVRNLDGSFFQTNYPAEYLGRVRVSPGTQHFFDVVEQTPLTRPTQNFKAKSQVSKSWEEIQREMAVENQIKNQIGEDSFSAIRGYTYKDHEEINRALRTRTSTQGCLKCQNLMTAINKLPPYEGTSRRLTNLPDDKIYQQWLTPGSVVSDKGFFSTTYGTDFPDLGQLSRKTNPIKIEVVGKSGRYIEGISAIKGEHEVLFPPNTKFKVEAVWKDPDGIPTVRIKEIN